jgi:hypothetical protein
MAITYAAEWLRMYHGEQHFNTAHSLRRRAPVVSLHGNHSLKGYLEHLPLFMIEQFRDRTGTIDSAALAKHTIDSILGGRVEDAIHARLILNRIQAGDVRFCSEILSSCTASGCIGKFKVPGYSELVEMACREPATPAPHPQATTQHPEQPAQIEAARSLDL